MKAAFVREDFRLIVRETPRPEPGPTEVLIKIAYCGICGTDVHWLAAGMLPPDAIIGHEVTGWVSKAGDQVSGWSKGDSVVVMPLDPCGQCGPCLRGKTQLCEAIITRSYGLGMLPGGFSQYMLVKPSMLFRVPSWLDMKLATLTEPWAVARHGLNLSNFTRPNVALVMGAGPIGLLTAYALKAARAERIYITEPTPWRAQRAMATGADAVMDPSQLNSELDLDQNPQERPEYIFDCAGTENSLDQAVAIVRPGGRIVVLGIYLSGNVAFAPMKWLYKEITVSYSLGYSRNEFQESLNLLCREVVNPEAVISDIYPLGKITEAFQALSASGHSKILIDCHDC